MDIDVCAIAPSGWAIRSIDQVCKYVTSGGTPSRRKTTYYLGGEWPWVKTQELQDRWIEDTEEHITNEAIKDSSAKILPKNTILLAMYGATVGQLGLLRKPMTCNQACCAMVVNEQEANHRYLFYQLWHARKQLRNLATGAAQQNLSGALIKSLRLPFPNLSEQRAIADILGSLDDKIELNRRMNETLEATARAIFKSWFVDFEPVHANMEGRETSLPKHLADLFPDRLIDSELGKIPKGWSAARLPDAVEINPSRILRKGELAPYLDMANMPTRGHCPDTTTTRAFGSGMRFQNGDTLVARITPCLENGKTAFVDFLRDGEVGWGSTEFIVLRPKPPLPKEYGYCLARSTEFRDFAIQSMSGPSGRQRVPAESLAHFMVALPPNDVSERFGDVIGRMFAQAHAAANEMSTLSALRDALLPKLISGEMQIADAETMAEARL